MIEHREFNESWQTCIGDSSSIAETASLSTVAKTRPISHIPTLDLKLTRNSSLATAINHSSKSFILAQITDLLSKTIPIAAFATSYRIQLRERKLNIKKWLQVFQLQDQCVYLSNIYNHLFQIY